MESNESCLRGEMFIKTHIGNAPAIAPVVDETVHKVTASCDALSINCSGVVGGEFLLDGKPLPDFSKLTLVIEVGKLTRIIVEAPLIPWERAKDGG